MNKRTIGSVTYLDLSDEGRISHLRMGQLIGEHLADDIDAGLTAHYADLNWDNPEALDLFYTLWDRVEEHFPEYVEEYRGIAQGSGQDLARIIRFTFEEELWDLERDTEAGNHCSSLAVRSNEGILFAHNEDWDLELPVYLVKAHPKNKPKFLSVGYAGQAPGSCAALNSNGIAYAGNSITTECNSSGMPKLYLLRTLLDAKDIDSAVHRITQKTRTIGNNSVIASGREQRIVSFEWAQRAYRVIEGKQWVAHTNNFIGKGMAKYDLGLEDGESYRDCPRFARFMELLDASDQLTLRKLKKIMRDRAPQYLPDTISKTRYESAGQMERTVCSVVINPGKKELYFAGGAPHEVNYRKLTL